MPRYQRFSRGSAGLVACAALLALFGLTQTGFGSEEPSPSASVSTSPAMPAAKVAPTSPADHTPPGQDKKSESATPTSTSTPTSSTPATAPASPPLASPTPSVSATTAPPSTATTSTPPQKSAGPTSAAPSSPSASPPGRHGVQSTVPSAPNPALAQYCGLNIAMVFDLSASISNSQMSQLKSAGQTVAAGLAGTPSQIAVFSFASYAPATGNSTLPLTSVSTAGGVSTVNSAIAGLVRPPLNLANTNWDRGLAQVVGSDHYDVVLFMTDGDPTVHGNPAGDGTGDSVDQADIDAAVSSANSVKGLGARVIAIGVSGSTTGWEQRLQSISGPSVNSDYYLTNFVSLGSVLAAVSTTTCRGTVTVVKKVRDGSVDSPAPGWNFSATGGGVSPTSGTTDETGSLNFDLDFSDGGSARPVAISEASRPGYGLVSQNGLNATCTADGVSLAVTNVGANGFSVLVGSRQIVSCEVINQRQTGTLSLVKHVGAPELPGYPTSDPATAIGAASDWSLTATAQDAADADRDLSGHGAASGTVYAGVAYSLAESGPSGYTSGGWSCSPVGGFSLEGSTITVDPRADVSCTITNTASPIDLGISVAFMRGGSPASLVPGGGHVDLVVTATNVGDTDADQVVIGDDSSRPAGDPRTGTAIPADFKVTDITTSGTSPADWSCTVSDTAADGFGGSLACTNAGVFQAGDTFTATLAGTVRGSPATTLSYQAWDAADEPDVLLSNNIAADSIRVAGITLGAPATSCTANVPTVHYSVAALALAPESVTVQWWSVAAWNDGAPAPGADPEFSKTLDLEAAPSGADGSGTFTWPSWADNGHGVLINDPASPLHDGLVLRVVANTELGELSATRQLSAPELTNCGPVDLSISKSDRVIGSDTPGGVITEEGQSYLYDLTVTNKGTVDATAIHIEDAIAGVLEVDPTSLVAPTGWSAAVGGADANGFGGTVTADYPGPLAPGASATITFKVQVSKAAQAAPGVPIPDIANTATVSSEEPEENPSDNTATVKTPAKSVILTAAAVCRHDVPWLDYSIQASNYTPTKFELRWWSVAAWNNGNPIGAPSYVQQLPLSPTSGRVLWPGATIDAQGNPTGWPGWKLVNGTWVADPTSLGGDLRPSAIVQIVSNPSVEAVQVYPPGTPNCVADPSTLTQSPSATQSSAPQSPVPSPAASGAAAEPGSSSGSLPWQASAGSSLPSEMAPGAAEPPARSAPRPSFAPAIAFTGANIALFGAAAIALLTLGFLLRRAWRRK